MKRCIIPCIIDSLEDHFHNESYEGEEQMREKHEEGEGGRKEACFLADFGQRRATYHGNSW